MVGVAMMTLSLLATQIGLGHNPAFGWKKTLFLLTGLPLVVFGVWILSTNRGRAKLLPCALAYTGLAVIGIGLAAHRLRIGHNPELRWTKALLFISGLGLIFIAGKVFKHRLETDKLVRTALLYLGVVSLIVAATVHQLGLAQDPEFKWKRLTLFVFGLSAMALAAAFRQVYRLEWILRAVPRAWWNRFILILWPFGLLLLNSNWPFQSLGHMDPWYYFGEFIHFPHYQALSAGYPGERLMWILPGYVLTHVLSPTYGLAALHFIFF